MRWISNVSRQSVLPILFGISLTTFGLSVAILLYNMFDKQEDSGDDRKKDSRRIATSKRKEFNIQFTIPEKYVSAVIGRGGSVIKRIEHSTNTRIKMERENSFSSERICQIRSDDMENIYMAQNLIQNKINNIPVIETFELFVPFEASKNMFKENMGSNRFSQKIQKFNGTKLIIENNPHVTTTGLKRRIILKGTADQIASAIIQIEDNVQEEVEAQAQLKMQLASARHPRNSEAKNINNHSDNEICDYSLSYETCRTILEKDDCIMQEIEKVSGTRIIIDDKTNVKDEERKVTIKGTTEQVKSAMSLIEIKIQEVYESNIESNDIEMKSTSESSSFNNNFNTSNNALSSELEGGTMEVYVSAMKTPSQFWIQVIGRANVELQHLVDEMTEYYNNEKNCELHTLKNIMVGQMVAAKFQFDEKWYRAEVISIVNSTMYEVFFVDYGDLDVVSKNDIFELCTDMLSLRRQAVECSLANVKPQESLWNNETADKFAELVHLARWKPLIAKVRGYKERPVGDGESRRQNSPIPCIDLYDRASKMNIGDELIQMGIAQIGLFVEEEVCLATNSTSHDKCNLPFIPFLPDQFNLD